MTDGVARELEQAEARLSEARLAVRDHDPLCEHYREPCSCGGADLVDALVAAAIEVGRLRALASLTEFVERMDRFAKGSYSGQTLYPDEAAYVVMTMVPMLTEKVAALAAREEVQG